MPLFTPRTNPKSSCRRYERLRLSGEAPTTSVVLHAREVCHQPPRHQNQSPFRNGCHAFDNVFTPERNPIRYTLGSNSLIPYPTCFCPSSGHQKGPLTSSLRMGSSYVPLDATITFVRAFRYDPLLVQASTPLLFPFSPLSSAFCHMPAANAAMVPNKSSALCYVVCRGL